MAGLKRTVIALLVMAVPGAAFAQDDKKDKTLEERVKELEKKVREQEKGAKEKKQEDASTFRVFWKDGLQMETADGNFKIHIGGRIQADFSWISEDKDIKALIGDQEDGFEFRRARITVSGTIYKHVVYKAQYEFSGSAHKIEDAYIGFREIPVVGNIKVGHVKEPFSLENMTSSRFVTFMERANPVNAINAGRNAGILFHNTLFEGDRMMWAIGVFRPTDSVGRSLVEGEASVTGRITGIPWIDEENNRLLHVGLSYSLKGPANDTISFDTDPEIHLADDFVDTGAISADRVHLGVLEVALVFGPFSVQGEYLHARVDATSFNNPTFHGYYILVSWFPTGEHRAYKKSAGAFSRVRPIKNMTFDGEGWGAIEIAARYSRIDLNDEIISGGELHGITLGVNWYLNPNTRITVNYVFADLEKVGDAHGAMVRFQVDF